MWGGDDHRGTVCNTVPVTGRQKKVGPKPSVAQSDAKGEKGGDAGGVKRKQWVRLRKGWRN